MSKKKHHRFNHFYLRIKKQLIYLKFINSAIIKQDKSINVLLARIVVQSIMEQKMIY